MVHVRYIDQTISRKNRENKKEKKKKESLLEQKNICLNQIRIYLNFERKIQIGIRVLTWKYFFPFFVI